MPTRLTYRHRALARDVLREIFANQSSGTNGSPEEAVLSFADRFLNIGDEEALPRSFAAASNLNDQLTKVIADAGRRRTGKHPLWATRTEAVLHLSERLLGILPSGETYQSIDSRTVVHRRRSIPCGTYSTPSLIANKMSQCLLAALKQEGRTSIDIADLSLEAGHFALSLLAQKPEPPVRFFGIDRDPAAIGLARLIMKFAMNQADCNRFEFRTTRRDSIINNLPNRWPREFDAIIGNPPWKTRHPTDTQSLRRKFGNFLNGQFDVYLSFIIQAHNYLKPGGLLTMLVPNQFLFNQNAAKVRNLLLTDYEFLRLDIYPRRSFIELPSVAPVSFLVRKRTGNRNFSCGNIFFHRGSVGHNDRPDYRRTSPSQIWKKLPGKAFHPLACRENFFLVDIDTGTNLSELGYLSSGAKLGRKNPICSPKPFVGFHGRHIRPFHACTRDAIRYECDMRVFARKPPVKFLDQPKVLFQDVRCMTLADRIVAAKSGGGTIAVSSTSMFVPYEADHVNFFEALLNSQFANAWYKLRDVNRSVKLSVLAPLPIVMDLEKWGQIVELGDEITQTRQLMHRHLDSCVVVNKKKQLNALFPKQWTTLCQLLKLLNKLIFDMYGLTHKQRRAIAKLSHARVF